MRCGDGARLHHRLKVLLGYPRDGHHPFQLKALPPYELEHSSDDPPYGRRPAIPSADAIVFNKSDSILFEVSGASCPVRTIFPARLSICFLISSSWIEVPVLIAEHAGQMGAEA